jgi:hypothetical protein
LTVTLVTELDVSGMEPVGINAHEYGATFGIGRAMAILDFEALDE